MDFLQMYRAIASRGTRFDGQFFTAVRTTGIYCRPSCPSRTPKPDNVTFYPTSAAAHAAGYRACKRCLPEALPGSPLWNVRSSVATKAMRLIREGKVNVSGVSGLADALGYSPRQLDRILQAEFGASALSLARAHRAQIAGTLISESELPFAQIAFAAGFSSIRQFNATLTEVFSLTPTQLRAYATSHKKHLGGGQTHSTDTSTALAPGEKRASRPTTRLDLRLPVRTPYDTTIFDYLAARAVRGVERSGIVVHHSGYHGQRADKFYERTVRAPHGLAYLRVRYPHLPAGLSEQNHLELRLELEDLADLNELLAKVRQLFDTDADPHTVDRALSEVEVLAPLVCARPGMRLPGALDGTEILMRALVGQQISVKAALKQLDALADFESEQGGAPTLNGYASFPRAATISHADSGVLRAPRRRITTIVEAARDLDAGRLRLDASDDLASLSAKLLPRHGIGQWSTKYVAMRLAHETNILMETDAGIKKAVAALSEASADQLLHHGAPWLSYAQMHLRSMSTQPITDRMVIVHEPETSKESVPE